MEKPPINSIIREVGSRKKEEVFVVDKNYGIACLRCVPKIPLLDLEYNTYYYFRF